VKKSRYTLEEFLDLKYKIEITPYYDEEYAESGYVITSPELSGIKVFGETIDEALIEYHEAKIAWYEMKEKMHEEIPQPFQFKEKPSGRLTVRLPIELHEKVNEFSSSNSISLNLAIIQLINNGFEKNNSSKVFDELTSIKQHLTQRSTEIIHGKTLNLLEMTPLKIGKINFREEIQETYNWSPKRGFGEFSLSGVEQ
jgi:predicted RNase H-like HicB family nuclease